MEAGLEDKRSKIEKVETQRRKYIGNCGKTATNKARREYEKGS